MARKTLTSGLLGTVTGLNKEEDIEVPDTLASSNGSPGGKDPETEMTDRRKPGRPKATGDGLEVNVTFRLPDSLVQELKMLAVIERSTQKEIVIAALRNYLAGKLDNKQMYL